MPCPTDEELQLFVSGECFNPNIREHIKNCSLCQIKENQIETTQKELNSKLHLEPEEQAGRLN